MNCKQMKNVGIHESILIIKNVQESRLGKWGDRLVSASCCGEHQSRDGFGRRMAECLGRKVGMCTASDCVLTRCLFLSPAREGPPSLATVLHGNMSPRPNCADVRQAPDKAVSGNAATLPQSAR